MTNLIKNKIYRRILFSVVLIAGLVIAARLLFTGNGGNFSQANILGGAPDDAVSAEKTVNVQIRKISPENIIQNISVSAVTKPQNEAKVSSKMTGRVVDIYFKEGDWVNAGQAIIQLEQDQILRVAYNNAQTNLINTRASIDQDIRAAEVAVGAAKTALANAEKSLNNVSTNNEQMIDDAYTSAFNTSRNAVLTGTNAIVTATDLQYKYFFGNDQEDLRIADKKSRAVWLLLGESNAGRWISQFIIPLNGGVKGQIEEAAADFSQEKIDRILIDIVPAMQAIRDLLTEIRATLDWKYNVLASEKTAVDTSRAGIEASLNALSNVQQVITNAKLGKNTGNDAAQSAYDSAKKQLESAEANLASIKKKAELQIAVAQGQLDSVQAQLGNTTITAPISGIISKKFIEAGEMAVAGSPVVNIVNTKGIEIELFLTEFDIGKVLVGQEAQVSLAAYPNEEFLGKIYYVGFVADPISKKFPVKIQLGNEGGKIKAGMLAEIRIITKKQENVLVIPKTSVFIENGIEKVYTVKNSVVEIKSVKTEVISDSELKVIEGLIEGDEVVIEGNYDLNNGDLVSIL
jgi:RND family efflux transporter MFP subunit